MNNLAQSKQDAKQAFLDNQRAQMLEHCKTVSATERAAIIRQINSFLPVTSSISERTFWKEFKDKLETVNRELVEKKQS